jgi:drug/metabolite transporter (DMT)-like permease
MKKNKYFIYLLIMLAVGFWGISYVWMKVVLEYYNPVTTMFLRLTISGSLLSLILMIMGKKEKIKKEDYKNFILLSFFSPFCYFLGESFGLVLVTPTIAAVIIATIPVFTPWLGFFVFKENLTRWNVLGFIISFTGVIIMVLDFEFRFSADPRGILFLFSAVISALINIIYLKKLSLKYSSGTIIKVQNILGALFFLPLFLIFDYKHFMAIQPTAELVWSLIKLSVFASTLAFMFYTIAVREIGVAKTSVFSNLIPVATAIFSYFILRESIDINKLLGIIIVISGLLLSQSDKIFRRSKF